MTETQEGGGVSARITKFVERHVLRSADRVVVIHPRFGDYIEREMGVDPKRIEIIRNWTHLKPSRAMTKLEARSAIDWPVDRFLAVHTGNMGAKQGLHNVVEAARLADACSAPIQFVLVGDGSERSHLEHLAGYRTDHPSSIRSATPNTDVRLPQQIACWSTNCPASPTWRSRAS